MKEFRVRELESLRRHYQSCLAGVAIESWWTEQYRDRLDEIEAELQFKAEAEISRVMELEDNERRGHVLLTVIEGKI